MTAVVANPNLNNHAKVQREDCLINRIFNVVPSQKAKCIFKPIRISETSNPNVITNNKDYSLIDDAQPSFIHIQSSFQTQIFQRMSTKPLCYLQEEHELFQRCIQSHQDLLCNSEYQKHFIQAPTTSLTENRAEYASFLNEFRKVLSSYERKVKFTDREFHSKLHLHNIIDQENDLLEFDLMNNSTVELIYALRNILDRVTDEEQVNCFCLASHSFLHPMTSLLSPVALAISFFNSRLLTLGKPDKTDHYFYKKDSLPKITYINLTGIYSEIDIDTLYRFSKNVQTIAIYDERTGGPAIISKPNMHNEYFFKDEPKEFTSISEKVLLIPLKCDSKNEGKVYGPNDILEIFENIVLRSISHFKPMYIVLNCSLIFGKDNQTPFALDEETFAKIISRLSQLVEFKVIVYPFKLPNIKNPETKELMEKSKAYLRSEAQQKKYQEILDRFAVPYDENYFRNCFVNMMESLANLRNEPVVTKDMIRNPSQSNPLMNEMQYKLAKFYKSHSYYNFLYSKSRGVLARIIKDRIQPTVTWSMTPYNLTNKLPLISSDNTIEIVSLRYQEGERKEIILGVDTQYFVDYENLKEPTIYIFNAKTRVSSQDSFVKIVLPLSHFAISLDRGLSPLEPELFGKFEIENQSSIPQVKDFGICKCESYIFQVYGTSIQENRDTTEISYFDFGSEQHYKVKITNSHGEILPRHSVTACAFKRGYLYYLYIFGGLVQPDTKYNNRSLGNLDMIDIVEVYTTLDPTESEWEYKILSKDNLFNNKHDSFIPYKQSYAHYIPQEDKILLMGGTLLSNSVMEWTFPVFEFNVAANQFTSFTTFLNERRDNIYLKTRSVAIADKNKNFFYDHQKNEVVFLVPTKDSKNPFNLYSYHLELKMGTFVTLEIEKAKESKKDGPVLPAHNNKRLLAVKESKEIIYRFKSHLEKKILLEFVQWRLGQNSLEILGSLINRIDTEQENIERELGDESSPKARKQKEKTYMAFEYIRTLVEGKDTQDMFINLDNRLTVIEEFLKERLSEKEILESEDNDEVDMSMHNCYQVQAFQSFHKDRNTVFLKNPDGVDISILASDPNIKGDGSQQACLQNILADLSNTRKVEKIEEEKVSEMSFSSKDMSEVGSEYTQVIKNDNTLMSKINESYMVLDNNDANVVEFKKCISRPCDYQGYLSVLKNGLTILVMDKNDQVKHKTLRFKVVSDMELEEISFYLSPSSITLYNGAVVCYFDQEFKRSHPHLYNEYKHWVLYANVDQAVTEMISGQSHQKYLIFKKLFALTSDESIFNRCLLLNQNSLFLFGGKSMKYKSKKNATYHSSVSKYDLFKLKEVTVQTSFMKDNEAEEMRANSGECVAVSAEKFIFVCQKENAKEIEIFKSDDGIYEDSIPIDMLTQGGNIHMNLVNFREKEEILVTFYTQDKDMKFVLLDINKKAFEEKVMLVPKNAEDKIPSPMLYSGLELLAHNVNNQAMKEIKMYNMRGDKPQVIVYNIQVGKI